MRMKNRVIIPLFLFFVPFFCMAQLEGDTWTFNFTNYVRFNKATNPVIDTFPYPNPSGFLLGRGASTMSDKNGNLLFYTDGLLIFNRLFNTVPSVKGTIANPALNGSLTSFGNLSQTVLTIPYPGNDSLYIIFYIYHQYNNSYQSPLLYALFNARADGGLGDIYQGQRDIPVFGDTNVAFKLSAIPHCNKKDIWVIGHLRDSDKYFSVLVNQTGVTSTVVFSGTGFIPSPSLHSTNNVGCIKVSPLGNRLAAAFKGLNYVELSDFNTTTGAISNPRQLIAMPPVQDTFYESSHTPWYGPFGIEFSPSGDKLYTTSTYQVKGPDVEYATSFLYQFDASLSGTAAVQSSRVFIDSMVNREFGAVQVANNGKMYLNAWGNLNEIAQPEAAGLACGYTRMAVASGQQYFNWNLPIFLQSYFRYPIIATGNCQFQNISFNIQNPIGVSSIAWDFGDPASGVNNVSASFTPTHIYSTQGIYTIKAVLQNSNGCGADTIKKVIHAGPFKVFLGNDTTICKGDTLQLKMNIPGGSNFWHNNSFDTVVKVTQPGKYWVRVSLGECTATDTIEVFERNLPQFTLGADTIICSNTSVTLAPNPALSGGYAWSNNAATPTITVSSAGNYWLQITDNIGCKWRDTIGVSFKTLPNFSLGRDTAICQKDTLVLNATVSGATGYTWSTGATTPQIKTYQSGIYWCDVNKQGCIYRDSIMLTVKPLPIVHLGNDTTLCENTTLLLDAQNPGSSWLWNTGSNGHTYLVSQSGFYKVTVTKNNCSSKDSINIAYELRPRFSLGTDRLICPGEIITLQPVLDPLWQLLWQDGSGAITYRVAQPGLYYLDAITRCGTTREDILFTRGLCKVNIPNAFTPNGDGLNDVLKALGTEVVTNFTLKIYNRYGQLVFETRDKNKGWDGRIDGQRVNNGAYAYICTYRELNGTKDELLKGTVLVIQ
jgi:gliding motility-associated-like protein